MHKFSEDLLQFIWQHRLFKPQQFKTVSGKVLQVLKPGDLNTNAGPDFFNASIRMDNLTLAGNIEIHINTSDWLKHGHQHDSTYNNLILHVVYEHDLELTQNLQNQVEVLEIKNLVPDYVFVNYESLIASKQILPCLSQIKRVTDIQMVSWLERMVVERLEEKVMRIETYYKNNNRDYLQTFYTVLLRNFGFKVNALPFELLSLHLPVQLLLKHSDNILQLEALLLGTSGLLEEQFKDEYIRVLQNEFEYLRQKYGLQPLKKELFKLSRLRPANSPHLRLVQFAALVKQWPELFSQPHSVADASTIRRGLQAPLSKYWQHHYQPDGKVNERILLLGDVSAENIIINTFAPFLFFYSRKQGLNDYSDLAIWLLESCVPESNQKTKLFPLEKAVIKSAADSQSLIQLYDNYCGKKKCLNCGIAAAILKS